MSIDRRALAAVRFIDAATSTTPDAPLRVTSERGTWVANRAGLHVLTAAEGLEDWSTAFEAPPTTPPPEVISLNAEVVDPTGRYLPRAFNLRLPRPEAVASQPIVVRMPPASRANIRKSWSRVTIAAQLAPDASHPLPVPLEGAAISLFVDGYGELCLSLTDHRGEGLVYGWGLAAFEAGDGDDLVSTTHRHRARVVYDPARTDLETGRRTSIPDPDDLWARRDTLVLRQQVKRLPAGGRHHMVFSLPRT